MSLSTLRKNFHRIVTLIIEHGAESMRCLLDHFIQRKYSISFKDFVSNHQHNIYHHFNNGICCLCSKDYGRPYKTVIVAWQMRILFDINSQKLSRHKHSSKCEYCCSTVKSTLQLQDIDITLLRFFLVTYFEEQCWQSCFTSGMQFHDFINTHKHDIFHLLQLNTRCCLCQAHPDYMVMVAAENDRLNQTHWEIMFHLPELPCTQHINYFPNGYTMNPCSVSATIGIRHSDLNRPARMTILSKLCTLMRHIDLLVNARNTSYAHAITGELSDEKFRQEWIEIENSIMYIFKFTGTVNVDSKKVCISELREKSLEESMCLNLQCLILKQMHGDELVLEACRKLQDTVELTKDSIDLQFQQIKLQIQALASSMSDVVSNELSIKLNEYSDITRNIIDNTRREIEFHDEDKTYVKTSAVTAATELLDSKNLLIIFGRAGSGKTSTALEIASVFHANGYIIIKLEQNIANDFKTYFISKNKQLIIFEDLFGKADIRYNEDKHSQLLEVLKPHVFKGLSKFIITVRSYKSEIDDEIATYHHLLSKGGVLNLNGSLSYLEKERILTMHATHNHLEICLSDMQSIIATDSYLGFPEAVRLFCSFDKFFAMGHAFFTSPTRVLQDEISALKRSGDHNSDSALQYCALISLMLDSAGKGSFSENICSAANESNDPFNKVKNINRYVMEYLYQSLFSKEMMITLDDVHEICKNISDKYIKNDINSNTYTFQHVTVFEAVLTSYWHPKTMEDVIRYFQVDILAEYVRPFDFIDKDNKKYLIVPITKCPHLVKKMFEKFLGNYLYFIEGYSFINQSKCTLNLLNSELDGWFKIEENVLNIEWGMLIKFTRPFNCKKENNQICGYIDKKYLIQRFIMELDERTVEIHEYIERYCCGEFVKDFNDKLTKRFQLEKNVANCKWEVIRHFIRPTTIAIKTDKKGTVTKDAWLIYRLIDILLWNEPEKRRDTKTSAIKHYIEKYGCETFVKYFNEQLMKRFQTVESVVNCKWEVINNFIRPNTFQIDIGQVGTVTKDDWLILGLVNRLLKHERIKRKYDITCNIKSYIETYGCKTFVKDFNEVLAERFKSKENVNLCKWKVIHYFIHPTTFPLETGQLGTIIKDVWLIERLIDIILIYSPEPFKRKDDKTEDVKKYIEKYGCKFVDHFNRKLAENFQSEEKVVNCKWMVIYHFIRPTTFTIEIGQIGVVTLNVWLINKLLDILLEESSLQSKEDKIREVRYYIEKYGCETFVKDFNEQLMERLQSRDTVINCIWEVILNFIRPNTFNIQTGKIGSVTKDDWLIYRLADILVEVRIFERRDVRAKEIKDYIEEYGCETFVNDFNDQFKNRLQAEQDVLNCKWVVINHFLRPSTFEIERGQVGYVTNDDWLIHKLINILVERKTSEHKDVRLSEVKDYIEKYGLETFINQFNAKLLKRFHSEKNVVNCKWEVIDYFIRPTSFQIEIGRVGTVTKDDWLILGLVNTLLEQGTGTDDKTRAVKNYIKEYGCETFVKDFNKQLSIRFQSEVTVKKCTWELIQHFIRPTSFQIENVQQGTVTKDVWLIQRLIDILVSITFQQRVYSTCMLKQYIEKYGCEQFVQDFNAKLKEWFQLKRNVLICEWDVVNNFIRPATFNLEIGQVGTVTKDHWLIYRLVNALVEYEPLKDRNNRALEVKDFIEKYGCEQFVKEFNKKFTQYCKSEENVVRCEWKVIDYFIRPSRFRIEIGRIGIAIDNGLLIHKLTNILMQLETTKCRVDSICWVKGYIEKYGCEQFVKEFNKKLEEWIMKNIANCNWSIFISFVQPKSCNFDQNIGICIDDEHVMMYLFSKLEQVTDVNAVKLYINTYGSSEFKANFNERLKEKVGKGLALDKECKWEKLEVFFESAVEYDSEMSMLTRESDSDIGETSDSDSSVLEYDYDFYDVYLEFDENGHSEDSESDSS